MLIGDSSSLLQDDEMRSREFLLPLSLIIQRAQLYASNVWQGRDLPYNDKVRDVAFEKFMKAMLEIHGEGAITTGEYARASKVFAFYFEKRIDELRADPES